MEKRLIQYLEGFITDERKVLFDQVLGMRTRYLTVVLEDIYQSQNASAVLRTSDCFGIQDVHIIENRNEFKVNNQVVMGASKWLTLHKYNEYENNALEAMQRLKQNGYRVVATTPHSNDVNLEDFEIRKGKCALVFGTELTGISDIVRENADEFLKIPMCGFTESFNISVCAAMVLHHLSLKLRRSNIRWQLSDEEKESLRLEWLRKTLKRADLLEKGFFSKKKV